MPYPIRFKLINRETGEAVKGEGCPILLPNGTPGWKREDFYTYVKALSCADFELHVALTKDVKGAWIYQKVGH